MTGPEYEQIREHRPAPGRRMVLMAVAVVAGIGVTVGVVALAFGSPPSEIKNATLQADGSEAPTSALASGVLRGTFCSDRASCKGHGDCVNGERCLCDDGWSGERCDTAAGGCTDRVSCSNHGDCVNQSTCRCDKGYEGAHCETEVSPCQHGGVYDAEADSCRGCAVAWKGRLCDEWDPTVDPTERQGYLSKIGDAIQLEMDELQHSDTPPLPGDIGTGVDVTDGSFKLPIVSLTYTDGAPVVTLPDGKAYRQPKEADYRTSGGETSKCYGFSSIGEYRSFLGDFESYGKGQLGVAFDYAQVFAADMADGCNTVAFCYKQLPAFHLDLGSDMRLHHLVERAVDWLPPTFDETTREDYFNFIRQWGTHYTSVSLLGGMASFRTAIKGSIWGDGGVLRNQAVMDFECAMNPGSSACSGMDPVYTSTKTGVEYHRYGGDPTKENFREWRDSIPSSPVQTSFEYRDIVEIIADPARRAAMSAAIASYRASRRQAMAESLAPKLSARVCPGTYEVAHQSGRTVTAVCSPGNRVIGCGFKHTADFGERYKRATPTPDGTGCTCYDHGGVACEAVCAQFRDTVDPEAASPQPQNAHSVVIASGSGTFRSTCPAGYTLTSCGTGPTTGSAEAYPRWNPVDGSSCECYNYFGAECAAMCAKGADVVTVQASGGGTQTATCPDGRRVAGCGYAPAGGRQERFHFAWIEGDRSCVCYNYFGVTCTASCIVA